jgi:RHS repeat-associated protein
VSPATSPATNAAPIFVGGAPAANPAVAPAVSVAHGQAVVNTTLLIDDSGGGAPPPSGMGESPQTGQFTHFPVYTLDQNDGTVLLPGAYQLATLDGAVDLRAQVSGTTVSSYSWNTTGLTDAQSGTITGTSTYDLQFQWKSSVATAEADTVTLTVTGSGGAQEVQTYTFWVPAGTVGSAPSPPTWSQATSSDMVAPDAPSFVTHNASIDANTGAADAVIGLPSYNPNVPALALAYDSQAAVPQPVVVEHHTLDPGLSVPSQVSAQLTFNGTAGTTYYYDTSSFSPGDVQIIAPQADASALATGRYSYSLAIGDIRGTTTTATVTGTTTVLNESGSGIGAGWTVAGLEAITAASGGVILDLGGGDRSLWFSGSFGSGGGTFTSPAGDFSTLVQDSGGGYTRTLTDGTVLHFDSGGAETSSVDRDGRTTTFGYSSGNLTTITDPYNDVTTLTYSSGLLSTISDPAGRVATFTHSGSDLTGVTLPDSSTWGYGYDGSGRLTQVTDPNSKTTTLVYDSGGRVSGVTQPDGTAESVTPFEREGWVAPGLGTSGSPAAATLLAASAASFTDPNSHTSTLRPDWYGLGETATSVDALGDVATNDLDSNGLATVSIDPLNRITQAAYDASGNITKATHPDGTADQYTYNGFAEVLVHTDPMSRVTTFTYNGNGDNTVIQDPLGDRTTMTYYSGGASGGMLHTTLDPLNRLTTDTYDAQGRLQTVTDPLGNVTTYTYTSAGLVQTVSDPDNGGATLASYTYDALNRQLTSTDALGDVATTVYDSGGNKTVDIDANGDRTTYAYDSMNRLTTLTDGNGNDTVYGYDSGGNQVTVTDALSHTTTTVYDALNRVVSSTDPNGSIVTYAYDADGERTVLIDPDGNHTTWSYDSRGRVTTEVTPIGTTTYVYDADGELTDTTDRDGRRTTYSYDSGGRQTGETWVGASPSETITYTYDADGEMLTADDSYATLTFTYDSGGRQASAQTSGPGSGQPSLTLTYTYDDHGDRTGLTDDYASGGAQTIVYDAAHQETEIYSYYDGRNGPKVFFSYDSGGRMIQVQRPLDGLGSSGPPPPGVGTTKMILTTLTYDAADQVVSVVHSYNGTGALLPVVYSDEPLTYNSGGQVTDETTLEGATSYTYDSGGQLTGASGAINATYTYDANGNRTMTGYSTGTDNEMTASPGTTYTYDNQGNMTGETQTGTGDVTTFAYDYRNRLVGATEKDSGGTVLMRATYTYDALDRRIGVDETVSGTRTTTWTAYDGQNPYLDTDGSGTLLQRYTYGPAVDEILARTSSGGTTDWYLQDNLGSVTDVVSGGGTTLTILDHYAYDAFGVVTSQTNATDGDRFQFAGMQADPGTGLDYDRARWYSSWAGNFNSQDPIGFFSKDTNLYRYVNNSPTNSSDPSGKLDINITADLYSGTAPPGNYISPDWKLRQDTRTGTYLLHPTDPALDPQPIATPFRNPIVEPVPVFPPTVIVPNPILIQTGIPLPKGLGWIIINIQLPGIPVYEYSVPPRPVA